MPVLALTLAVLSLKSLLGTPASASAPPATQPSEIVRPSSSNAPPPASIPATISVHKGSLQLNIEAQGYFEPIDPFEVRIRPKAYGGELTIVSAASNGAKVKRGDALLQIESETLDKQIAAAQNDLTAAQATLTRTQADARIGQQSEELAMKMQTEATQRAQDEIKWFENVDGPNMLAESELAVKNSKANVDDQQDELNELKKMYKSDDLTTDTADIVVKRAVRNLENNKIILRIQTEQNDKVKTSIYPTRKIQVIEGAKEAEQQLEALKAAQAQSAVLRETGLVTAHTAAKGAEEHLSDLKGDREKLTVIAPSDGVVFYGQLANGAFQNADERALRVGEKIAPQQVVMTLCTPGKVRLHLDLPEDKFFSLRSGVTGTVSPVAFPQEKIACTCDAAAPAPVATQQGPQYVMTCSLEKSDPRLEPGMRANFQAASSDSTVAILVPRSAVADGNVWVKTDDGIEKRHVTVGKSDEAHTQITEGLHEGDEILTEAQK